MSLLLLFLSIGSIESQVNVNNAKNGYSYTGLTILLCLFDSITLLELALYVYCMFEIRLLEILTKAAYVYYLFIYHLLLLPSVGKK